MKTVGINSFVRRQVENSQYSHYEGTFEEVALLAGINLEKGKVTQGTAENPRVILVPVSPVGFYSSIVMVQDDTKLEAVLEQRRAGEEKYVSTKAVGAKKLYASEVNLVLYSREALAENKENSTDCDYELVSINASVCVNEPLNPVAMARNYLEKVGGTKAEYSAKDFAESIWFWKDKVLPKV